MSSSNKENDIIEGISLKAKNERLRKENASLAKYALGFSRRFRVTGPNATPVYMQGALAVNDDFYADCREGRVEGEMDQWYPKTKEQVKPIPLVELPKLEYHIEGMHTVFRFQDELDATKFVVSLAENGNCSIEMDHHIVWFYNVPVSSPSTFDEMIQKLPDQWQMNKYGGGAKLTLQVDKAAEILRQLFGDESTLADFHLGFDMNEAGGDRFTYTPKAVQFDPVEEEKDQQKMTLDELKEENVRLEKENKHLWWCKMHCSRHVKITGAKDTPVFSEGEALGDGAWWVEYGGILKPNPRSKGMFLSNLFSVKVHVERKDHTVAVLRMNDLDGVQKCILTVDEDGKCSLSLQSKDLCLDGDVSTTASFGSLNDFSSKWQHKTDCWSGKRVAKLEFCLFEMKTILRDVFQGDTKARAKFNKITLATQLFEDDLW